MTEPLERLLDHLTMLAEQLPLDAVDRLAAALVGSGGDALRGRLSTLATTGRSRQLFEELDRQWSCTSDLAPQVLGVALRAAGHVFARAADRQRISIVWTGPTTEAVPLRRTEQVLEEIIGGATSTLLIVSFVVYKVEEVMAALRQALARGVNVRMVLEAAEESGGKISFDQVGRVRDLLPKAQILTWPPESRSTDADGNYGSIHVKCAVADREVALVSSANLTGAALELNMELGLLIRGGPVVTSIADHFDELIRRNILVDVSRVSPCNIPPGPQ